MPLFDKSMREGQIVENAKLHYLNAARNCFHFAANDKQFKIHIERLLVHFDNQLEKLLFFWQHLLAHREQWLDIIYKARNQKQEHYEFAIKWIEQHELQRFKESIPQDLQEELTHLVQTFAHLAPIARSRYPSLAELKDLSNINREQVRILASLLLTSQHTLRKSFDHYVGLKKDDLPKEQYIYIKEQSNLFWKNLAKKVSLLSRC